MNNLIHVKCYRKRVSLLDTVIANILLYKIYYTTRTEHGIVCMSYLDLYVMFIPIAICETTSFFSAYALLQRVANGPLNVN